MSALAVWPNKYAQGHPARVAPMALEPWDLFTLAFDTDAHFAAYEAGDCRMTLDALDDGARSATMIQFRIDVDAHGVVDLAAWRAEVAPKIRRLPGSPFAYWTRGGAHVAWTLAVPTVVVTRADAARWASSYRSKCVDLTAVSGVVADPACADFTRLFRAPHATRDGVLQAHGRVCGEPTAIGTLPALDVSDEARMAAEIMLIESSPAWAKVLAPKPSARPIRLAPIVSRDTTSFVAGALRRAVENVRSAGKGARHAALAKEAFGLGGFVGDGCLDAGEIESALADAVGEVFDRDALRTLRSQIEAGAKRPRGDG